MIYLKDLIGMFNKYQEVEVKYVVRKLENFSTWNNVTGRELGDRGYESQ